MKKISLMLWIGLFINILITCIAWFNLSATAGGYDYDHSHQVWAIVFPLFIAALVMQIASIGLLFLTPKVGRIIAGIGAFFMLPIGMVFFMGYMSSYEKKTNQGMTVFSASEEERNINTEGGTGLITPAEGNTEEITEANEDVKLLFKTTPFFINGVIFIVLGGAIMAMGLGTGGILVGAGVLALVNGFRLKNRIVIGLSKDELIITPGLYSETYRVPYNNVKVTHVDNRIYKLHIQTPEVDKTCTLRKGWLEGERDYVSTAMGNILSKLTEHNAA
ncbi:hypothetical protein GE278_22410 (plasmid) [Enterobacteriaceae bacterium Kacie_13]|nr:hypothetical protein GE278_22410 [Enterobacteriaceae bacterium Kacie_13]